MKLILASLVTVFAASAQAAPFTTNLGPYKIIACHQTDSSPMDICQGAKTATFTHADGVVTITVAGLAHPAGFKATSFFLEDNVISQIGNSTSLSNSYTSSDAPDAAKYFKLGSLKPNKDGTSEFEYTQDGSGWPTREQNASFAFDLKLKKIK